MKNKFLKAFVFSFFLVILSGCFLNKPAVEFKNDYESLNGKTNASGKIHRTVNINNRNPFITTTAEDIIKRIENNETFYVYFGDALCPWCRSVIESAIESALIANINTIYYVPIWDKEGKEILRDKYLVIDGELTLETEGTDSYKKLLSVFDSLLKEYTIKNGEETINTNEKRIYAPNFIYVKSGKAIRLTTGISEKQTDSRGDLTEEIKDEQFELFIDFFLGKSCTEDNNC